jgi:hypothetical protein
MADAAAVLVIGIDADRDDYRDPLFDAHYNEGPGTAAMAGVRRAGRKSATTCAPSCQFRPNDGARPGGPA